MEFLLKNNSYIENYSYVIIGLIILLTSIKVLYKNQFDEFIALLKNGKYLIVYNKIDGKTNFFNTVFYLFFTTNLSLFCCILIELHGNTYTFYTKLIVFFTIINVSILSKFLLEKISFEILNLGNLFKILNFERSTYITLIYVVNDYGILTIYLLSAIVIISYMISLLTLVLNNQKTFLKHWFYFILYICAFEISPVLIGAFLITK